MAVKKSELYSILWDACNKLRGGVEPSRYKDYVPGDTPYLEWYSAHIAAISSAELNGTIEGVSPLFGAASVGLKKMALIARQELFKKNCSMRLLSRP